MKKPFVTPIINRLAKRAGIKITVEPRYGYAAQIVGRNGQKRYLINSSFDINTLGASDVAKDKDYSYFFLKKAGYSVVKGEAFFSPDWARVVQINRSYAQAYAYAQKLGFPVIVKPNRLSQGSGVAKVHNRNEFMQAVRAICKKDNIFLVQKVATGHDYRIVVLDGQIVSAYERLPLSVIGNGRSTIAQLLRQKQREFKRNGRDTMINSDDYRITNKLKRSKMSLGSVPNKGEVVELLDNRNLSTGGDAIDVTDTMHPTFRKLAIDITYDMGLRYCGVDLMVEGDITSPVNRYTVLEVNAAPGLDHYVSLGRKQKQLVNKMYLKVLKAMVK